MVLPRRKRRSVPIWVLRHAEVLRPDRLPIQSKCSQIAIGENGVNSSAVCRHRRRGVASLFRNLWYWRLWRGRRHDLLPKQPAFIGIEANDLPLIRVSGGNEEPLLPYDG